MKWYTAKIGGGQGLVVEEDTGRNVAVAYDKKDAPLLAAAPDMLAALECIVTNWAEGDLAGAVREGVAAIQKARGEA